MKVFSWKELRQKLREKSVERVATGLIALALLVAGFFGRAIWDGYQRWLAAYRNLPKEIALDEAHRLVGSKIADVVPFRNKGRPEQLILVVQDGGTPAVLTDPGDPVLLLEGINGAYQIHNLQINAYDILSAKPLPLWGVIDVDGKGLKQVYAINRSGGSGAYGFTVRVYDTVERNTYDAEGGGAYGDTGGISLSPNAAARPAMQAWLSATGQQLIAGHTDDTGSYLYQVEAWRRKNGADFAEGKVVIQEFPGKIPPSGGSTACVIDDGAFVWVSFFKGAVFAYNKARDVHFVVFKPESDYGWRRSLLSGRDYLWLDDTKDVTALAFNKTTHVLGSPAPGTVDPGSEFAHAVGCAPEEK